MVSDRHRTVICGYTRFDIEDLQYLVGTRKYNSTVNWKFPENRERNTAGGIVLIGDDMDSIFRSTVATDADFHRHLGVFGIASTAQLSRTVTGVQGECNLAAMQLGLTDANRSCVDPGPDFSGVLHTRQKHPSANPYHRNGFHSGVRLVGYHTRLQPFLQLPACSRIRSTPDAATAIVSCVWSAERTNCW